MWLVRLLVYCCLIVLYVGGSVRDLEINPLSTLHREIESVKHYPLERRLQINLTLFRRCDKPSFLVRLSGTSLYLLDLAKHDHTDVTKSFKQVRFDHFEAPRPSTYHFTYPPLSDEGTYFLEVIVLFCVRFNPASFEEQCLEDVHDGHNLITSPYSFNVTSEQTTKSKQPRWVLDSKESPSLLPTRYQEIGCAGYCEATSADTVQHNKYNWTDKPDFRPLLKSIQAQSHARRNNSATYMVAGHHEKINICFVGASHSMELRSHAEKLNLKFVAYSVPYSRFPDQFSAEMLSFYECSYAIIGYGQWPGGLAEEPYNALRYETEMSAVLQEIVASNTTTKVFVRSVNYNALGARYTACPPLDHRSPIVIDMYNAILKNVTSFYNIPYIDTNHIMGPLWDSALDWSHPRGRVYTAEVEWILYSIFNHTLQHSALPVLAAYGEITLPDHTFLRFSDSERVYFYQFGKAHAFPVGYTTTKEVVVVKAAKRPFIAFGPDLDNIGVV